jgi:hypothetical protein
MDLSAIVSYDTPVDIEIIRPDTKQPVGLTVKVVSLNSERVRQVERVNQGKIFAMQRAKAEAGQDASSPEVMAEVEALEDNRIAAAIVDWDFHGNSFGALGVDPPCTDGNKLTVLREKNADFIKRQVFAGASNIANFTTK